MARLEYLTQDDLSEEYAELFEVDEDDSDDVLLNVHRAMANNPRLLEAWGDWVWTLYDEVGESRIRELAILAVARAVESRYVWHQHVSLALEAGVSRDEIISVADGDFTGFTTEEKAVLEYVTTLATDSIDDTTHSELAGSYPDNEVVAILFLAGEYLRVSTMIDAMAIDLEEEFVGWQLQRLD